MRPIPRWCPRLRNPERRSARRNKLDRLLARITREKGRDYNNYTGPQGDPGLRREIARRAWRWGRALSPHDLVITVGCTEALVLALRAVTRPGDTVAIESTTYFGLLHALEVLGLKALELPTDADVSCRRWAEICSQRVAGGMRCTNGG